MAGRTSTSRACVMSQSEEECPAATHESAEEIQQEKRLEYKTWFARLVQDDGW